MSRKPTAFETKMTLARLARLAPDDIDGYVVVYAKDAEVIAVMTNADGESTTIGLLARAIEQRAAVVGQIEDRAGKT